MRPLLVLLVCLVCVPAALADGSTPPPPAAVAACQAEAAQLGKDAFVAKYGPTEPFGHCYASHATPGDTPAGDDPVNEPVKHLPTVDRGKQAVVLCTAEGLKLGKKRFAVKYGSKEPFGACVKQLLQKPKR
jgi:hypothetical protein